MSKFHLSQELTDLISNAVKAFALRIESEHHISKDTILDIWERCSDDIVNPVKKTKITKKSMETDKQKQELQQVQKLVKTEIPEKRFALRKNAFGNYEHKDTGFVFDPSTKDVFGKQVDSLVKTLTVSDIELCKQYGFKYKMPERFDDEPDVEIEDNSDVDELGLNDEQDVDSDDE